jgi:hypothetical protein
MDKIIAKAQEAVKKEFENRRESHIITELSRIENYKADWNKTEERIAKMQTFIEEIAKCKNQTELNNVINSRNF